MVGEARRPKISVIGSGNIGSLIGLFCGQRSLGDVVLFDIVEGMPQGKALDLYQLSPVQGFDCKLSGTNSYADIANSDLIVVTAGVPRKPGMSRDDLVNVNATVMKDVGTQIKTHAPNAMVICVTNPLDVMVQVLHRATGFPSHRVVGMAGILDAARFRMFLSERLGVSVEDIQTLVLGGHGDSMVPLPRHTSVGGIPLMDFVKNGTLTKKEIDDMLLRTKNGGAEVLGLMKFSSAYHAPAASATQMIEAYLHDKKRLIPASAYLTGQYGIEGFYVGVPIILGGKGVEKIIELPLIDEDKELFNKSSNAVIELHKKLQVTH